MKTERMNDLMSQFKKEYAVIYDAQGVDGCVAGYTEALNEYEYRIYNDDDYLAIVRAFSMARNDFISSDREAAAFAFAYKKIME